MTTHTTTAEPDYMDKVPASKRGYFHSVAAAAMVLLATFSWLDQNLLLAIGVAVVAAIDLALVLAYTRAAWRKALYPLLYAVGPILVIVGVANEFQVGAVIGLAVAILGTQIAAAKTPATGHAIAA